MSDDQVLDETLYESRFVVPWIWILRKYLSIMKIKSCTSKRMRVKFIMTKLICVSSIIISQINHKHTFYRILESMILI